MPGVGCVGVGGDLNLARGRIQRVCGGIGSKISQAHALLVGSLVQSGAAEPGLVRHLGLVQEVLDPFGGGTALVVLFAKAHPLGEIHENIVIVAGLPGGRQDLGLVGQEVPRPGFADVFFLEGRGAGKDHVAHQCGGGEENFM